MWRVCFCLLGVSLTTTAWSETLFEPEPQATKAVKAASAAKATYPAWSEQQMIGPPDVPKPGDDGRAWASWKADAGAEWVKLTYAQVVPIKEIKVYENLSPGAISRVVAFNEFGEGVIWEGVDTEKVSPFVVQAHGVKAKEIKIELITTRAPGWNEIDAVELVDVQGQSHWAVAAEASSSYARGGASGGGEGDGGDLFEGLLEKKIRVHLVGGAIVYGKVLKIRQGFLEIDTLSGRRLVAKAFIQMIELP